MHDKNLLLCVRSGENMNAEVFLGKKCFAIVCTQMTRVKWFWGKKSKDVMKMWENEKCVFYSQSSVLSSVLKRGSKAWILCIFAK